MYYLYAMAHNAAYKKVKAFSESDLDDANNFTNISSHNKLVRYRDEGKARKGEDFNPSEGPIDPELVMIAGNGKPHGSIAIGDGLIRCPSTLRQIKACQTSSRPGITHRPRPVELAIEVSLMDQLSFRIMLCVGTNMITLLTMSCVAGCYSERESGNAGGYGGEG